MNNLFTPGFSQPPAVLAGRKQDIDFVERISKTPATPNPIIFYGTRGMGKTVFIHKIEQIFQTLDWDTIFVEAGSEELFHIVPQQSMTLEKASIELSAPAIKAGMQFGMPVQTQDLLSEITTRLKQKAVLFIIDEFQLLSLEQLKKLGAWLQETIRQRRPLLFIGAGLPTILTSKKNKQVSYFERAYWRELSRIQPLDSLLFLKETFEKGSKSISLDLLSTLTEHAGGYPLSLQMFGFWVWEASSKKEITSLDTHEGIAMAEQSLHSSIFHHRWTTSTPKEKEYLHALAALKQETPTRAHKNADIAEKLGKKPTQTTYLQERLLLSGTLIRDNDGLNFLIPAMTTWITQELD